MACAKKSASKPVSQVSSISNSDGENWNFTYDGQGRVATILYINGTSSSTKTFQYASKQIWTSATDQSGNVITDTLDLNSDGTISSDKESTSIAQFFLLSTYSYVNGEIDTATNTATIVYLIGIRPLPSVYTFQNGDLTSYTTSEIVTTQYGQSTTSSNQTTYTFYANQPAVALDVMQLGQYETYGNMAHTIKCAHMVQSSSSGGSTSTYVYTYDSLGRVAQVTYGNGAFLSTTITWQ
jgi:YD repeat-containing protein